MTEYGRKHTDGSRSGGQPPRLPSDSVVEQAQNICAEVEGENKGYQYLDGSRDEYPMMLAVMKALAAQPRDEVREDWERLTGCVKACGFDSLEVAVEHLVDTSLSQGDEQPDTDGLAVRQAYAKGWMDGEKSGAEGVKVIANAWLAARDFIESHVADPDITDEMTANYARYLEARALAEGAGK